MEAITINFEQSLLHSDRIVLRQLIEDGSAAQSGADFGRAGGHSEDKASKTARARKQNQNGSSATPTRSQKPVTTEQTLQELDALNDLSHPDYEPTILSSIDVRDLQLPKAVDRWLLQPYIKLSQSMVRHHTDGMMFTYILIYLTTSIPSAVFLFYHFTWVHAVLHLVMQVQYTGTYNCLRHQHIHQNGILRRDLKWFDMLFPYVMDPLVGHTWNSYYYHHVKHHHVEGNGPDDLSSTVRYQRDSIPHFLHYFGRFFLLIWFDLPSYFFRKGRPVQGIKAGGWELLNYAMFYTFWRLADKRATFFVLLAPFIVLRIGLMAGNWGQHAFVDSEDPDSDYRSSITVIDTMSNRYCFNDGYHTSHHLNPLRHWREHPQAFIKARETYAKEGALVFHDIDYIMITLKLLSKNYDYLARCMVPIGDQVQLSMQERADLLRRHTRRFTEEELRNKFGKGAA